MIRPRRFGSNVETLASNRFQSPGRDHAGEAAAGLEAAACAEADALANALSRAGVTVHVFEGQNACVCPDEVFPNNWISSHADGTLVLYPMMAPSRRLERRTDIVDALRGFGYRVRRVVDLAELEAHGVFLEGTGSLVLDRRQRIAYACSSPRTSPEAVEIYAERLGYEAVPFDARDRAGHPIYHTNVLMSVGTAFAVVCAEAIRDERDRRRVLQRLSESGKEVIDIGFEQLRAFAGNLLELRGARGPVITLSERALASLRADQQRALSAHGELVPSAVDTIETYGGGSVRCMLAEVHLPR